MHDDEDELGEEPAGKGGEGSADKLTTKQRHAKVIRLKKAGFSLSQIAKATGYTNKGTVSAIVTKYMRESAAEMAQDLSELRQLEAERLDHLQRALWVSASEGNPESVRTVLRIMQRRAQMFGLDVPQEFQMRLAEEQVAYMEAALRRVLDAVQIAVMQAAGEEVVAQLWPTVMGEIVPRELEAAAASTGA